MFRVKDISIKRKLTLIIMVTSISSLLLVSAGFVTYEMDTSRESMRQDLMALAEVIGNQSAAALAFTDADTAKEILKSLRDRKHIVAAALYDKNGHAFARFPEAPVASFPQWPERTGTRFEPDGLVIFHTIAPLKDDEPAGTLYLKSDLGELKDRLERYALVVVVILLASILVTYFLSRLLQRIISRPIFHLAETAKAVTVEKNYSVRATKYGNDELGQLIDDFNEMLGEIQQRDAALQNSNDELEKRVLARTQELQSEIEERRRAESSLQQQFRRISLLNHITQAISERQDSDSILRVVLRQLEDHLNLDMGCVALFDRQTETLNLAALRVKNPLLALKLDLHEGSTLALADTKLSPCREGQTVYLPDTLKSPVALPEKLAIAGLRSAVGVPLLVEHQLFGVLIAARLKPDSFCSGDCEFLRTLSEHVGLAAHQAQLYSELETAYNELHKTQATVMQQERLKALGQMASGIAHDINNALSPVVGFTELMLQAERDLSSNGKRYLQHIRTAGEDIAHIVARLREFYRRREDTEFHQEVNLNTIASQVVDMTRPRWRDIPQSNGLTVEVQTELAADVPDLLGIESELREALTNLVINAVDALPSGGRIILRTRLIPGISGLNGDTPASHVVVEISDNGVGMSEETRRRCLEPFFSTKGKRGTGLGLAMVYGVVQRHEGRIEVESEPGRGTTFRLSFPIRKTVRAGAPLEESNPLPPPMRILCIDDEPLLRDLIKEMLERDGHIVEVTDGGQSGLDAFRAAGQRGQPFDAVITDLGMPYLDGRQVAKVLKHESPRTPVIMLTGWGTFMKEDNSMSAQVDSVLSKPPRSKELRETLCRLVTPGHSTAKTVAAL